MVPNQDQTDSTHFMPFHSRGFTDDLVERAAQELNEGDDAHTKLEELRALIQSRTNFEVPTDDEFLMKFLRARKFDVQRAFATLNGCYHQIRANRDLFHSGDRTTMRELVAAGQVYGLPYRAPDGGVILVVRSEVWDTERFDINTVINGWMRALWHCLDDPVTQVTGMHMISDARGLSFSQMRSFKSRHLYMFGQNLRNSMPLRFKGFHMINESPLLHMLWSAISFFLSDKLRKRVHFHGSNIESLHKHFPKAILPSAYGGDIPTCVPDEGYLNSVDGFYDRYVQIVTAPGEK